MKRRLGIVVIFILGLTLTNQSQVKWDSLQRKNVIRFNPTPMLVGVNIKNITLSYERMIKRNQSIVFQAGYLVLPQIFSDTIAHLISLNSSQKYGVNLCLDYRYYPLSRNRRPAPDGLYISGFLSYYGFRFKNDFNILKTDVDQNGALTGKMNILNLGFSLGYQFLFWKRISLDLLMFGPSLSFYSGSMDISGSLKQDEIDNLDKEMVDKIFNRFPLLKTIFSGETLKFSGVRSITAVGFRYSVSVGVAF